MFGRVAPLKGRVVDELAHVVSTEIIPLFPPQALYEKQRSIKLIMKHDNGIDEPRINERCAELASTTYFGVCKS